MGSRMFRHRAIPVLLLSAFLTSCGGSSNRSLIAVNPPSESDSQTEIGDPEPSPAELFPPLA